MKTKKICMISMIFCLLGVLPFNGYAETVYYSLENVILDDGSRIDGFIKWAYTAGDFENGTSQFVYLDIPHSGHNQDDLVTVVEASQIEITFDGNVHDDGVDIKMVLLPALTPFSSATINTNHTESKYSIGGNGFNDGFFLSGRIVPTNLTLNIMADASGFVAIEWAPDLPGIAVLQEKSNLSSNWVESTTGSTNPVLVSVSTNAMFYRVVTP